MKITLLDRSNYYRGLLLLARKDRKITEIEFSLMMRIGTTLGFDKEFCENAIHDVLENEHIDTTPPVFSTPELARKFIKDGLAIATAGAALHPAEEEWLRATAKANGLDDVWFESKKSATPAYHTAPDALEVDHLSVEY
jgi:hypothetical protein